MTFVRNIIFWIYPKRKESVIFRSESYLSNAFVYCIKILNNNNTLSGPKTEHGLPQTWTEQVFYTDTKLSNTVMTTIHFRWNMSIMNTVNHNVKYIQLNVDIRGVIWMGGGQARAFAPPLLTAGWF